MTIKSTETRCWYVLHKLYRIDKPYIDIKNPISLQGVAKRIIWQQRCRFMLIVGFVNSVELMKYLPAPCFRTFYNHVLKPTSLFHLEAMFLLS